MTEAKGLRTEFLFAEGKPAYSGEQARVEANRCLYCYDAPCTTACPSDIDIPAFIRKIATGNIKGSARTIFSANIHGLSCARVCPVEVLCVGACVHHKHGLAPIQIGRLQRYATDEAYAKGWELFSAGPDSGKSVGIVGGGPAALACAHELRRYGHGCTIYERSDRLGGLNTSGVAPYKMHSTVALAEAQWILGIGGIDVHSGVEVGKDVTWSELERKHDALFIACGLGADKLLGVEGEALPGVYGAVSFIERIKTQGVDVDGVNEAVVIGGGNTAIDAARQLLGIGVARVTVVYRGPQSAMSGYAHEWAAARTAGAELVCEATPLRFEGAGKLERLIYKRSGASDHAGVVDAIVAQLALVAIGQRGPKAVAGALPGVAVEGGRIVVDDVGATGNPKVFAGGDCANGGREVVNATAEGKRAAGAIHRALQTG